MATLASNVATLADHAKRLDPDGKVPMIVELLRQRNSILDDMLWKEGNLPTGHRTTVRTGLPTVTARRLNEGVVPSKSTTAQIDEQCAMFEAISEVDADLVKLNGNDAGFRLSEASAFIEAMNQTMAQTLFYGNAGITPEYFTGFAPRYAALSGTNSQNILSAGGAGSDNTSIWLIAWGENTVSGIYPKGSKAGLIHEDLGEQMIQTGVGIGTGRMKAFIDRWQWKCGLAVRDWRYAVRIANIDVSNLVTESGAADLIKLMIKAIHRLPDLSSGRPVFYCNRTVREMLDIQALTKAAYQLNIDNVDGKPVTKFRGIRIETCDQILETESVVA
jgi:hypothetical protein